MVVDLSQRREEVAGELGRRGAYVGGSAGGRRRIRMRKLGEGNFEVVKATKVGRRDAGPGCGCESRELGPARASWS